MNGYQAIGNESSQIYENYDGQINRYQQLLIKAQNEDEKNWSTINYYESEISRYKKLQRKSEQKELLRMKTYSKVSELKDELTSFKHSQEVSSEDVSQGLSQLSKSDYKGVIEGVGSDKFKLTLADISLEINKIDNIITEI